jgi:hypothetical protein
MKIAVFSTKPYFEAANRRHSHELTFFDARLEPGTAG